MVHAAEMEWDNSRGVQSMVHLVQLFSMFSNHDGLLFSDGVLAHLLMSGQISQEELMEVALVAVNYSLPCTKNVLAPM